MMESFLTSSKEQFGKLLRSVSIDRDETVKQSSYRYSKVNRAYKDFLTFY